MGKTVPYDPKPQPNQQRYDEIIDKMSPETRLKKVFELNDFVKCLRLAGLRVEHPELPDAELKKLLLEELNECHNRNY